MNVEYLHARTGTGAGASTQTTSLDPAALGAALGNSADQVQGLHLLTHATAFNDTVLPAGTLLMAVNGSNTLAGVAQDAFDVVALSRHPDRAGCRRPARQRRGTLLFDGSDIGLTDLRSRRTSTA